VLLTVAVLLLVPEFVMMRAARLFVLVMMVMWGITVISAPIHTQWLMVFVCLQLAVMIPVWRVLAEGLAMMPVGRQSAVVIKDMLGAVAVIVRTGICGGRVVFVLVPILPLAMLLTQGMEELFKNPNCG
jgi:hypothetical protein